jgi:phosphodiesterase/alkaline phosphatase D-like protein
MTLLNRRELIAALAALGVAPSVPLARRAALHLSHGSRERRSQRDRVILWTRVTAVDPSETLRVHWAVASDPGMKQDRQSGRFVTDRRRGLHVKSTPAGSIPDSPTTISSKHAA